ncbi:MAG: hypothetical protein A2Z35_01345 [Actinobacteria bacterium RBG_19FT_COMBO_36_27]|nr:MAG: hypothetical protein A2Z35_01345 [Actinobacteria bacterium RBG_19FT_COMBO_36_27]
MRKTIIIFFFLCLLILTAVSMAETKIDTGEIIQIPQLTPEETKDGPILDNGKVYPFWGPVCMRYTYSVIYKDEEGRAPEYIKIYFNGEMINMEKENPTDNNYKEGVKYIFKFVPNKIGANFYYFEAFNGMGKARDSIINSPDNGPVLFQSDFSKNEIVLIDKEKNDMLWRYSTGKEWIGGISLSDNGKYLAVQSSYHIYLFDTTRSEPLWIYNSDTGLEIGGDVKGGIDISSDGEKIFAAIGSSALLFNKDSNNPVWQYQSGGNVSGRAYNVSISSDGNYMALAMAGGGESILKDGQNQTSDVLILWKADSKEPLWKYQTIGNFHDVSLSGDGSYIATATGCPDRRAYIFSKDSNEPLIRSEMLTRDSPVDESIISADGSFAVFGSESSDGAVFLFSRDKKEPIWKFPMPDNASVRALGFTPDGKYIGAATMFGGNVYIFSKDSNQPVSSWTVKNASLGALDIADDGSFIAVGGTDNKVHIFERNNPSNNYEFELNEFVGEIDISGNGEYIATGTSGSVYFFETIADNLEEIECTEIIEPEPEKETYILGNLLNENGEENNFIKEESPITGPERQTLLPIVIIFGSVFFVLIPGVIIYVFIYRKKKR